MSVGRRYARHAFKLDCKGIADRIKARSDEEVDEIYDRIVCAPQKDMREFLREWERNPMGRVFLDGMSYEEFKRRTEAGEFDE